VIAHLHIVQVLVEAGHESHPTTMPHHHTTSYLHRITSLPLQAPLCHSTCSCYHITSSCLYQHTNPQYIITSQHHHTCTIALTYTTSPHCLHTKLSYIMHHTVGTLYLLYRTIYTMLDYNVHQNMHCITAVLHITSYASNTTSPYHCTTTPPHHIKRHNLSCPSSPLYSSKLS
jgi:hypothetical protein